MVNPCSAGPARVLFTVEETKFPRAEQSHQGLVIDAIKPHELRCAHFSGLLVSNGAWRDAYLISELPPGGRLRNLAGEDSCPLETYAKE